MTSVRTIVDLPDDQFDGPSELCEREGISRAEAVRRAVQEFTTARRQEGGATVFGLRKRRRASWSSSTIGRSAS